MNMGLDMYAFSVKKENVIDTFHIKPDNKYLLHYWRKHPNLHGWFENLYYSKGGKVEPFDCQYLNLSLADLNLLEKDIKNFNLPETTGFSLEKMKNTVQMNLMKMTLMIQNLQKKLEKQQKMENMYIIILGGKNSQ